MNRTKDIEPVTDHAVLSLPHPARVAAYLGHFPEMLRKLIGPEWAAVQRELQDDSLALPEVVRRLMHENDLPNFAGILRYTVGMPGGTEEGGPIGMLAYLRQEVRPAPHFLIADELVSLLEHTDIAQDLPLSMMNIPFKRFYLELGRARKCSATIPNILSGDHIFEGAYVERGHHAEGEMLYIVLTGSPLGKADAGDDATLSMALPLVNPERPIYEVLMTAYQRARNDAMPTGQQVSPQAWTDDAFAAVMLLAKALLYIGLPGTRREMHPEKTEAEKTLAGLKSTAKRNKAQRRLSRAYDYILIGPQPEHNRSAQGLARDVNVSAHWRRGHYRLQAHGPQHALRKLLFIEATLVGANTGMPVDAVPVYKVV